ncbi:hypothetical protein CPB84DRAFT_1748234 [Gymnopilus junonius]|uniref:Uncharacterized protein n=1 Tax=Gymnopilus junonius TaxID=109634 RepID=A0A9P5NLI9_GYMJU|nr:hypothetical protein CPB84DRAFT_1748234 [Gymnopilus junonius]
MIAELHLFPIFSLACSFPSLCRSSQLTLSTSDYSRLFGAMSRLESSWVHVSSNLGVEQALVGSGAAAAVGKDEETEEPPASTTPAAKSLPPKSRLSSLGLGIFILTTRALNAFSTGAIACSLALEGLKALEGWLELELELLKIPRDVLHIFSPATKDPRIEEMLNVTDVAKSLESDPHFAGETLLMVELYLMLPWTTACVPSNHKVSMAECQANLNQMKEKLDQVWRRRLDLETVASDELEMALIEIRARS